LDGGHEEEEQVEGDEKATVSSIGQRPQDPGGQRPLTQQQQPPPPPSGYMQSLISKILTNVHITFENVIIKYVEEDIVLSLNIKKALYSTTDEAWAPAFIGKVKGQRSLTFQTNINQSCP
jgi:vacuolar protein sorting-associated protein 13B